ncbi:transposase [Paraburkholderia flagellata]|uniref:transposase n=1 Tax=Paraburkholderia flagellata TaxID=2883241 RepID=UPI001F40F01F|nr:transposase [Paraburkholderia flagellata]
MERKEYKRYSREFKLEAVRLAALGEKPKAQIARELGIRVNQLRNLRDHECQLALAGESSRYQTVVHMT